MKTNPAVRSYLQSIGSRGGKVKTPAKLKSLARARKVLAAKRRKARNT